MKIKAAVLRQAGMPPPYRKSQPLSIEEIELDPPGDDEVLIQIMAAGLCHSDLLAISGERARPTPMVLGHEAAGVVVETGKRVYRFRSGDHVIPSFVAGCGTCGMCLRGRPALCIPATRANLAGELLDGATRLHKDGETIRHHSGVAAFAEYAVVHQNALIKIDKELPFEFAALFGCAAVTGAGAIVNTAKLKAGQSIAIVGLGGVGLCALLASVAVGAGTIVAIDLRREKLALARDLGAHLIFQSGNGESVEAIRNATGGGVHVAVESAGAPAALDLAYKVTKRGGKTVVAGMPGPDAKIVLSHLSLAAEERTLQGSYMGAGVPSRDIPRYIALYRDGRLPIDRLLTDRVGFEGLNEAFDRLRTGSVVRQVMNTQK
jgi:alcohol dehydrogenase